MTVRLTGAMSMRQNDFGGALSATNIAARITAGCVTATSRLRRLVNESIHPRTRSISSTTDSPPCGARVGSVSQIARSAGAVEIREPVVDAGVQAEQFRRLPGPLLGSAVGTFGDAQFDRRVDLTMAEGVERFVGGKSSGCHRIRHRMGYERQPDDLTHAGTTSRRFSSSRRDAIAANTSPMVAHMITCVASEKSRNW